jgi:hypothetical protein
MTLRNWWTQLVKQPRAGRACRAPRPTLEQLEDRNLPSLFGSTALYSVGGGPYSLAAGDFNRDGAVDLVTADSNTGSVSVLLGNGDGTFAPATHAFVGVGPSFVATADLNGDARPDIVATNFYSNSVSVLLGNGDGSFGPRQDFATGSRPLGVVAADLNNDGGPDLATANVDENTAGVLLNTAPPASRPTADAGGPYTTAEGQTITLDASGSAPGTPGDTLSYAWDLNGDGVYGATGSAATRGDEVGASPTFSAARLDGPHTYTVSLRVTESGGGSRTATATVRVTNVPPTVRITGPGQAVPGVADTYTLTADDPSPADRAAGFTYAIDWDGDGAVDQPVTGPGVTPVQHAFGAPGTYTVRVTAIDKDGAAGGPATQTVSVKAVVLHADPCDSSKTALLVGGTAGDDLIEVHTDAGSIRVLLNGVDEGTFAPTGRVIVYGLAGDDQVVVSQSITLPAWLYGGPGNDRLAGGSGNNVLLGEDGSDTLFAGSDRDLLIGGAGTDDLSGMAGDDILIGGTTTFDHNPDALCAIMAEWGNTAGGFATRVNHLKGTAPGGLNGPYLLAPPTVADDGEPDLLDGGGGRDWVFPEVPGAGGGGQSVVTYVDDDPGWGTSPSVSNGIIAFVNGDSQRREGFWK